MAAAAGVAYYLVVHNNGQQQEKQQKEIEIEKGMDEDQRVIAAALRITNERLTWSAVLQRNN